MTSMSPKYIYKEVLKETDAIQRTLDTQSESVDISNAVETASYSFAQLKRDTDINLQELDKNSEWDAMTIAFYGETNAGKSTIIETLRILMGEKTKQEQQWKFRQTCEKYKIDDSIVETKKRHQREVTELDETLRAATSLFDELNIERNVFKQEITAHIEQLIAEIETLPYWRRSLSFFWRIPAQAEKLIKSGELNVFVNETERLSQEHTQEKSKILEKIESVKKTAADIDAALKELEDHQDGTIIGDGQSDFTRETTSYNFTANGNKFVLIDVPGIEGKEELVREPIMQAVRKAHAVFYVTRKAAPPQKGDEKTGGKGTLEKIKEHLGSQTEVWTIFNKSIKSAEHLRSPQLTNLGEMKSLNVLADEMRKQLGEHYAGSLSVSAYPAFVASTDHFVPGNIKSKDRSKFLAVMDAAEILQKTGVQSLADKISSDMAENTKEKIRKSNFNKANNAVLQLKESVLILNKSMFNPLFYKLEDQARDSTLQLESATDSLKSNIESVAMSLVKKQRDNVRNKIYVKINDDIDNDNFKRYLERFLEAATDKIVKELPKKIEDKIKTFQEEVKDIADQFREHVQDFLEDASIVGDMNFNMNIKIDNGISAAGLISSVIGAAALFFIPGPGWVALAAGIGGIFISVYKAGRSFFSSDYKKAQQRKAADENIDKIFRSIELNYASKLEKNMQKLEDSLSHIKNKFQLPAQQAKQITSSLNNSAQRLELVSKKIIKEGGL